MNIQSRDVAQTVQNESELTVEVGARAVLVEQKPAPATKIVIGDNAVVTHYRLIDETANEVEIDIGEGAVYRLVTVCVGKGGAVIRACLNGRRAECDSNVLYVLNGDDETAVTSDFRHNADETVSSQLIKGAVFGRGRASFEGGVFIPYDKKAIDGSQQHRALLLSDDAQVSAVPKLEIYADDVKCAHGSAVGSLDRDALYYLKTRGIAEPQARQLLTEGFLNDVLLKVADDGFRRFLTDKVRQKAGFVS